MSNKRERSAGAVVFRIDNGIKYLLLHYRNTSDYWEFSRGNIEKGESEEEAAKREIKEETGISDLAFIEGFRTACHWFFRRDGILVSKEAIFFLAETKTKDVKLSHEHIGFDWCNYEDAMKKLVFRNSKQTLKEANEYLKQQSRHSR